MTGWLFDTFIYSGALIVAVLVLRRPVSRAFGPQIAYALWALPFLRLLLPPIVLPASFAPAEPAEAPIVLEPAEAPLVINVDPLVPAIDWIPLAMAVWLGGALAFIVWRVVTYRWMREDLLANARTVGEVGKVRLVETPEVTAPVAFGVLDKVIALPVLFMAQPDMAARDLAIAHELEHHRGRDLAANFAAQALLALHWFNPIAWMGWRAMRRDQEAACDARVLAGRGREDRARYAQLIAGTAAGQRRIGQVGALAAPMACPMLGDASIVHRLRSLTMSNISPRRRWAGRAFVGAGALALPLTASISYAASAPEPVAPEAPAAALAPLAPAAPVAAAAPQAAVATSSQVRPAALRDTREAPHQRFPERPAVPSAAPEPLPELDVRGLEPDSPEFERRMEAWGEQMSAWGERYGQAMARWGADYGARMAEWGERQREQALDLADRERDRAARIRDRALHQRDRALAEAERQREEAEEQREGALEEAERLREEALDRAEEEREQALEESQRLRDHALALGAYQEHAITVQVSFEPDVKSCRRGAGVMRSVSADGGQQIVVCNGAIGHKVRA